MQKIFHRNVPHDDVFQQICTNGSAPMNDGTARAIVKKYLLTTSPEPM